MLSSAQNAPEPLHGCAVSAQRKRGLLPPIHTLVRRRLLLHLAATEKLYQLNTFDGVGVQELDKSPAFKDWSVPMEIGQPARDAVKGHNLDHT
jgi:hypothetical protein